MPQEEESYTDAWYTFLGDSLIFYLANLDINKIQFPLLLKNIFNGFRQRFRKGRQFIVVFDLL